METAPKPGRDVPPKKDKLQTKRKVSASLGGKGSFLLRGPGGGAWVRSIRVPDLLVETAAILGGRDCSDHRRSLSRASL